MSTRLIPMLLSTALLAGCHPSPREKADRRVREMDTKRLRADAAVLYKDVFASASSALISIKESAWPASFRRFEPMRVNAYRDGFSLVLDKTGEVESGIYVVPEAMEIEPRPTERARFERVADGIFWYSFQP